jgi:short-subunit dehydrogenase
MTKKETILINGCSQGLGLELFNFLDSKKYNILGLTSKTIKKKNIFHYNPMKEIKLSSKLEFFLKKQKIDHIIHCTGGGFGYRSKFIDVDKLIKLFNVNFFSVYQINKRIIQNKIKNKKLNIIMIGSLAGSETVGYLGYSAAKSVLFNYNKNLSKFFYKDNVISKLVVPSFFTSKKGSLDRLKKNKPLIFKRVLKKKPYSAKQIMKNIEYLLKPESDILNGSTINISSQEAKSVKV